MRIVGGAKLLGALYTPCLPAHLLNAATLTTQQESLQRKRRLMIPHWLPTKHVQF